MNSCFHLLKSGVFPLSIGIRLLEQVGERLLVSDAVARRLRELLRVHDRVALGEKLRLMLGVPERESV
jgi:hypothetical protein